MGSSPRWRAQTLPPATCRRSGPACVCALRMAVQGLARRGLCKGLAPSAALAPLVRLVGTRPGRRETMRARWRSSPRLPQARAGYWSARRPAAVPLTARRPGSPTPSPRRHHGRHKGDYSNDVQAGERRQRFFLADGFFAAGFLDDLDFFLGGSLGSASPSAGATTVLMTPKR